MNKLWAYLALVVFGIFTASYIAVAGIVWKELEKYDLEALKDRMAGQDLESNLSKADAIRLLLEAHKSALSLWRECSSLTWDLLELGVVNVVFAIIILLLVKTAKMKCA